MNIWHIDSSNKGSHSISKQLTSHFVEKLKSQHSNAKVVYRDVGESVPLLTQEMIGSYYTAKDERDTSQKAAIKVSDAIVEEAKTTDIWVIGAPVYNFTMSASLKAWADQLARVGETFKYTESGPVGLLNNKKVYVVVTSGGTKVGSDFDFLTPWIKFFLGFVGVCDVNFIEADQIMQDDQKITNAKKAIEQTVEALV